MIIKIIIIAAVLVIGAAIFSDQLSILFPKSSENISEIVQNLDPQETLDTIDTTVDRSINKVTETIDDVTRDAESASDIISTLPGTP